MSHVHKLMLLSVNSRVLCPLELALIYVSILISNRRVEKVVLCLEHFDET